MRRLVLSFTLTLTLSAVGASSALAAAPEGAQKAPLFEETATQEDGCTPGRPTGKASGFAVLNTPGNELAVTGEVSLKGGAPNTMYEVIVEQTPGPHGCAERFAGILTTNNEGNGNQEINVERFPGSRTFSVELEQPGLFQEQPELVSSALVLD